MKVPISWLNEFINLKKSAEELQNMFTMKGLEIEEITEEAGEVVINIELTPNRGDCASIIGIARELAAYVEQDIKIPVTDYAEMGTSIKELGKLNVIDADRCPVYFLKHIKNVKISESPQWLKQRLSAAGIRPLNNVVDVTNYVMMELGQPLHAFDAEKIEANTIEVRLAKAGETLKILDGRELKLNSDDLVIADAQKPVAMAGIMGGEFSAISQDTVDIFLEAAFFSPEGISRSESRHELKTESSYRFTRQVDITAVQYALDRAVNIISEIAEGKAQPEYLMHTQEIDLRTVKLKKEHLNKLLGADLDIDTASKYLKCLNFNPSIENNIIVAQIPGYRNDIARDVDLIEEIARLHGYDNIDSSFPSSQINTSYKYSDQFSLLEKTIQAMGFYETFTHTLISSKNINGDKFNGDPVKLDNPININMDILRPSLIYNLLDVAKYNINQNQNDFKFYEIGPVFYENNGEFSEKQQLVMLIKDGGYFDIKANVITLMDNLKIKYSIDYDTAADILDPSESASIIIDRKNVASFGVLSKSILKRFKLNSHKFSACILDLELLELSEDIDVKYKAWSPFPSVFRDLSLVVPAKLTHKIINDKIKETSGELLKEIKLYDIYIGDKVSRGHKSMTYTLEFNSPKRTLTSDEIDKIINVLLETLEKEYSITLRPDLK